MKAEKASHSAASKPVASPPSTQQQPSKRKAAGAPHGSSSKKKRRQPAAETSSATAGDTQPPAAVTAGTAGAVASTAVVSSPDSTDEVKRMFRSWAWKREHRPDRDRFQRPYQHTMSLPASGGEGAPEPVCLSIKQQKYTREGFASTVWDSSIVVAKYLEKLGPAALACKRCLDLSAGCGLVGVVMAKLGAHVTVTDLAPNLPLLQHNCKANGVPEVAVIEHRWGEDAAPLNPPFDFIVACDVMYVTELVQPLLQSLLALSSRHSTLLVAHGRNRPAEPDFMAAAAAHFSVDLVSGSELDEVYQCSDVDVLRLKRL